MALKPGENFPGSAGNGATAAYKETPLSGWSKHPSRRSWEMASWFGFNSSKVSRAPGTWSSPTRREGLLASRWWIFVLATVQPRSAIGLPDPTARHFPVFTALGHVPRSTHAFMSASVRSATHESGSLHRHFGSRVVAVSPHLYSRAHSLHPTEREGPRSCCEGGVRGSGGRASGRRRRHVHLGCR